MSREIKTLIIDDNQADVDYLKSFFKKAAPDLVFEAVWEPNPVLAPQRLANESFDLVFLDYQMPAMSGLDALGAIRKVDGLLPVIVLTGMGNEAVAVEAMKRGAHDYLRKDQLTVPALSRAVMAALERKRLEDELARRQRTLEHDLLMARELQEAFLPQSLPHFAPSQPPDSTGLRFYHRYTPTLAVGGDFFDVLPLDEHSAGVFISDVQGHGMPAALVAAALRTLIEELKDEAGDPGKFLEHVNQGLHRILRQTTTPVYATAFYLILNAEGHQLSFSSAGHPPQLHLHRKTGDVTWLHDESKVGPMLGEVEDALFPARSMSMDQQDVFVLFTDGIIEVPNEEDEPFGLKRLEAVAREALTLAPPKIIESIVEKAALYGGATVFPEDVCIVAIEAAALLERMNR